MTRRQDEAGSILVLVLLVTLVMLALGLTAMWVASTGTKVSSNVTRRQEALFAAEAGLDRARAAVATIGNLGALCVGGVVAGCTGIVGSVDYNKGRDDGGKIMCVPAGAGVTQLIDIPVTYGGSTISGAENLTYTVYIRNDNLEFADPLIRENDTDRRVIIRSEGRARDRLTTVAVEAVVVNNPDTAVMGYLGQAGGNAQNTNSATGQLQD